MRYPFLNYSVQTLLFIVLCVGGFMAAYRIGLERGYDGGFKKWRGEQCLPRAYFVGDLAGTHGLFSAKEIENAITTSIAPTTWDTVGGPASFEALIDRNGNAVLVISQYSGAHEEIARILEELRAGAAAKHAVNVTQK